ncbi:MAG: hypothetical protein IT232_08540, partial [Flavobacteriales bacterium]|nr:hypothetical protein [Flavobacteriales bacterium]
SSRVLEKECYRNIEANAQLYRRRQAIVEHPYGIIKRQWGFYYIVTKRGIKRASADVGLMFMAFNLRRIFNILPEKLLKEYLKVLARYFLVLRGYFKPFSGIFFSKTSYSSSKTNLVLNA